MYVEGNVLREKKGKRATDIEEDNVGQRREKKEYIYSVYIYIHTYTYTVLLRAVCIERTNARRAHYIRSQGRSLLLAVAKQRP